MDKYILIKMLALLISFFFLFPKNIKAEVFNVSSQQEFEDVQDVAIANDSIIWLSGTYSDIDLEIEKDSLFILAEELGSVIFTGESKVEIDADYVTFAGFQFLQGDIGTDHIINITGSYVLITQININAYDSYKYLRVREESQYVTISYCNFENRLNLFDQNILSLLVDDTNPGYHKVQYCSFKNFDGTGNDMGIEPIRIGVSTQAEFISRCVVEYCYFTQCNGDGEIISSKATQNVYRYNTFEDNPKAELVLRHGSESLVYGNFFINGKGGVRVREGQNHFIFNNYFYDLNDRPIYLQNEDSDPLDNINIAFNTIVNCDELILGGDGDDEPTNVSFVNNVFYNSNDDIFEEQTGTETWIGNIAFGALGIPLPANGIVTQDPLLEENSEGFFSLSLNSPAINAAQAGFEPIPNYIGIENIDTAFLFDLMAQPRPTILAQKDLGCSEFSDSILVKPIVNEENTGPSYNTDLVTSLQNNLLPVLDLIEININGSQLQVIFKNEPTKNLMIEVYDLTGNKLFSTTKKNVSNGERLISYDLSQLPISIYLLKVTLPNLNNNTSKTQTLKFFR